MRKLLDQVRALPTAKWPKDDRIDWMLFRSQLEGADFNSRVLQSEKTDPQIYVGECTNGIFSLLKKEYDTPRKRALAATARLRADAGDARAGRTQFAETGQTFRASSRLPPRARSIRFSTTAS